MTREEEIIQQSIKNNPRFADREVGFIYGAKWADSKPPKGTSLIKWQTGIPNERCACIVTLQNGTVSFDYFGFWDNAPIVWQRHNEYSIKAWCKLSDVEPYKE